MWRSLLAFVVLLGGDLEKVCDLVVIPAVERLSCWIALNEGLFVL